jgi:hypothetical protein
VRWLDVVWSAVAGACCTFAIVHGLVWWRRREAVSNGLFGADRRCSPATLALTEQRLLDSDSIDAYAFWLRLYMIPVFLLLIALLLYTRRSMPAAKHWLGWLGISPARAADNGPVFDGRTRLYFEITALRKLDFFGQPLAVVSTTTGPLVYVGQASLALFTIDLADAAWVRGAPASYNAHDSSVRLRRCSPSAAFGVSCPCGMACNYRTPSCRYSWRSCYSWVLS